MGLSGKRVSLSTAIQDASVLLPLQAQETSSLTWSIWHSGNDSNRMLSRDLSPWTLVMVGTERDSDRYSD